MQFAISRTIPLFTAVCLAILATPAIAQIVSADGRLVSANNRIESLAVILANRPVAEMTAKRITTFYGDGPGVWSYEWRLVGEYYESLADKFANDGDSKAAVANYYNALNVYGFAYLPDNFTASERRAYERFRNVMYKINEYLRYPFEVVEIPFEGKSIIVHLYHPAGTENPPLVLYTGGIEVLRWRPLIFPEQVRAASGLHVLILTKCTSEYWIGSKTWVGMTFHVSE